MFQKWALDVSYHILVKTDMTCLFFPPLETTALQIQPCLKAKLYCLRFIITKGCAIMEFKCFSSTYVYLYIPQHRSQRAVCWDLHFQYSGRTTQDLHDTVLQNIVPSKKKSSILPLTVSVEQYFFIVLQASPCKDYFYVIFNMILPGCT